MPGRSQRAHPAQSAGWTATADKLRGLMFDLTDEQRAIQRLAREFAEGEVKPIAEEIDRDHRFPSAAGEKAVDLGLMGIPYDEQYGGGGADNLSSALAIEELTRGDSSVAITVA